MSDVSHEEHHSDIGIALVLRRLPVVTLEAAARFETSPPDAFTIAPTLVQPTSKGSVRLAREELEMQSIGRGVPGTQTLTSRLGCETESR